METRKLKAVQMNGPNVSIKCYLPKTETNFEHNNFDHRNTFRNCSSLQDLALNNNIFTSVPKAVRPLELLRTLEIGENQIKVIHNESLTGLKNLYGLRLAGNGLDHVEPAAFQHVPTLQVLNLAHNRSDH